MKKRQIEAEKEKEREMREKLREKEEMNDEVRKALALVRNKGILECYFQFEV